jgi:hypothetical protein
VRAWGNAYVTPGSSLRSDPRVIRAMSKSSIIGTR